MSSEISARSPSYKLPIEIWSIILKEVSRPLGEDLIIASVSKLLSTSRVAFRVNRDAVSARIDLMLTCRSWARIVHPLVHDTLFIPFDPNSPSLIAKSIDILQSTSTNSGSGIPNAHFVKNIIAFEVQGGDFLKILDICPNIRWIHCLSVSVTRNQWSKIQRALTKLEKLVSITARWDRVKDEEHEAAATDTLANDQSLESAVRPESEESECEPITLTPRFLRYTTRSAYLPDPEPSSTRPWASPRAWVLPNLEEFSIGAADVSSMTHVHHTASEILRRHGHQLSALHFQTLFELPTDICLKVVCPNLRHIAIPVPDKLWASSHSSPHGNSGKKLESARDLGFIVSGHPHIEEISFTLLNPFLVSEVCSNPRKSVLQSLSRQNLPSLKIIRCDYFILQPDMIGDFRNMELPNWWRELMRRWDREGIRFVQIADGREVKVEEIEETFDFREDSQEPEDRLRIGMD
ncbi:hypothetical protein SISNIDRAFT_487197 [Sistotremastrum niveocremeum HHB9708]|uniref:Uncharacterized protein n=1 Tax=Sistotremastrum niveocremeum HHB9708 TaxID=1314777 RepID=A0A164SX68_9AGAM|nr:hypothetical protein SISNIDRAFT_487197 [Sistotremastrum niveocremeum HHB9708]